MDEEEVRIQQLRDQLAEAEQRRADHLGALPASRPAKVRRSNAIPITLAIVCGVIFIGLSLKGAGSLSGADAEIASPSCDQAWARDMITRSENLGLLERMDVLAGEGMVAVVNGPRFNRLSYIAQEQLAVAIDCQIAGNGQHLEAVHFRRSPRGEDLARIPAVDLMNARTRYAADGWTRR